ncbi:methyltransferase type 12 [Salipiger sp. P9]|uniref:class I SAM-dependent methyltransferase n=1 Tax=Salipiger pentaromativorans TaxID=2943193 RepID=UPI0021579774|nr:methyltransferase type 12 [Salipiger pentaromativorans]MCR8549657.1 methyltransferase type 12 [Salipiger pentaromativorans]
MGLSETTRRALRLTAGLRPDSDLSLFVGQALRRPQSVSALVPASDRLAAAMAAQIPEGPGPVVELGPGTGKITRRILGHGVAPEDLHLVEINDEFVSLLRQRFPELAVHHCGAQTLCDLGLPPLRAVVSGLPLLSFPAPLQARILRAAFRQLAPGAPFIQYTYGPSVPVSARLMQALKLTARRRNVVWGNLPPAQVLTLHRLHG